jgi:hypothetical protein
VQGAEAVTTKFNIIPPGSLAPEELQRHLALKAASIVRRRTVELISVARADALADGGGFSPQYYRLLNRLEKCVILLARTTDLSTLDKI